MIPKLDPGKWFLFSIGFLCIGLGAFNWLTGEEFNDYFFSLFIGATLMSAIFIKDGKKEENHEKQDSE